MNYCLTTQNVCDHLQVRNKSKTKTQYIKSKSKISFSYFWNSILEKKITIAEILRCKITIFI